MLEKNDLVQEGYGNQEEAKTWRPFSTWEEKEGHENMDQEEPLHPLQQGWTLTSHMLDTPSRAASQEGQSKQVIGKETTWKEGPIHPDDWKDE